MTDDLDRLLNDDLSERRAAHLFRQRQSVTPIDPVHVEIDGRRYVNFSGNDYLGLTHHPRVVATMARATQEFGAGSGAAGLITGYTTAHAAAEAALARLKGTESAVLLSSGYQANLSAVQTLAAIGARSSGGVRFIVDKLAHASIVDAIRATGAPMRVFPHNNLAKLERLLSDAPAGQMQVVLTESIFSMDGDAADLRGIAQLKQKHPFVLLLDEAHATGVYGEHGAGYANELGLQSIVDLSVVTCSKALGCIGGAVCASRQFCDALVNHGRAYIYSTSVPAPVAAAIGSAIDVMRDEPADRQRVRELARRVRDALKATHTIIDGDSPIIPVIVGAEEAALEASRQLRDAGLIVVAVRPPTVPRGSSRLRITLSSEHSDEEVQRLVESLRGSIDNGR